VRLEVPERLVLCEVEMAIDGVLKASDDDLAFFVVRFRESDAPRISVDRF
jgi:hypothetical protein